MEAAAIISSKITQPLEDASLRVLYLAERVSCQLVGEDMPQVLMDPPPFIFAPLFLMNAEYQLWRNGIPYAKWLLGDLDYDKFSETRLMPSFPLEYVSSLFPLSFLFILLMCM